MAREWVIPPSRHSGSRAVPLNDSRSGDQCGCGDSPASDFLSRMTSVDSIALLPAHEIARRVRAREVSPAEVLDACMAQVERHNPGLNAVVTLNHRAREEAEALERRIAA